MNKKEKDYKGFGYMAYYYVKSKKFMPDLHLTPAMKDLLLLIDCLDQSNDHCFANVGTIAENLGLDKTTIQSSLKVLIKAKLVSEKKINGKWRYISHLLPEKELKELNQEKLNPVAPIRLLEDRKQDPVAPNRLDSVHIYNNKYKDNIIKNKKDINLVLHPKAKVMLSKMKKSKREEIEVIYQIWNTYKKEGAWQSHRKLTPDMVGAIEDNLKMYTLEDICTAIDNYAKVLQGDKYFWNYVWPLSSFLSVKDEKNKDAYKKWWRFLPENFIKANYFKNGNGSFTKTSYSKQQEKLLNDPIPALTGKFIKAHSRFTPKGWKPSIPEHNKFIQTTLRAQKQVKGINESWVQDHLIFDLLSALTARYTDKGGVISPGNYCSDFTWDTVLYQFLVGQGVNPDNLFNYCKGGDDYFDSAVVEEEQLTKDIERNMSRQNPEPLGPVGPLGDKDTPELDYMLNV